MVQFFIDSKIEENIINENEDWKRYRDDSFQYLCNQVEKGKLRKQIG